MNLEAKEKKKSSKKVFWPSTMHTRHNQIGPQIFL